MIGNGHTFARWIKAHNVSNSNIHTQAASSANGLLAG
jgi:hypothetical protein